MGYNIKSVLMPTRLKFLRKRFGDSAFRLLDVGCGSGAASVTKKWFSRCEYHGIDRTREYGNSPSDFAAMDRFFLLDLVESKLDMVPENYYDAVIMSHVIEHLPNGQLVLADLVTKIRIGGVIYIEYPGLRSTYLPSKQGSLNFYDDPTHCRVYSVEELSKRLQQENCRVLEFGTRRDWLRIILMPILMIHSKLSLGYVTGAVFWDLLGFAEFICAERVA